MTNGKRERRHLRAERLAFAAAITTTVACVAILAASIATWSTWWVRVPDDPAARQAVVDRIERAEIPVGDAVPLPADLARLTTDGTVSSCVDGGTLTVTLRTKLGMIDRWGGYVYRSDGRLDAEAGGPCAVQAAEVTPLGGGWFEISVNE